jgi:phosphoserine phosphatase RsbU/P
MFLYTDGLSEARGSDDAADDEYGLDRVTRVASEQAAQPPAALIAAFVDDLRGFTGGGTFHDDLTLLAIQRRV